MSEYRGKEASILIVDDRSDKLFALQAVLEPLSRRIVTASSGAEALRILLREEFALILLDVSMPGMDGFETASLIRLRAATEHTPIIFVTSINVGENHVSRGYSLGAVDYIFTPIEPEVLRAKVAVFLDLFDKTLEVQAQSEQLRRQAEQRAASLEIRLHEMLDRLNVGVFRSTTEGQLLEVNPAFRMLIGLEPAEDMQSPHIQPLIRRLTTLQDAEGTAGEAIAADVEIQTKDLSRRFLTVSRRRTVDMQGTACIEGIVEDITERKMAAEALTALNDTLEKRVQERTEALELSQTNLRRSERLASLGTLAAGIAHEINNPLNAIMMASQYALRLAGDQPKVAASLNTVVDQTKRCGRIIQSVLQFAKDERRGKSAQDINDIIRQSSHLAKTYVKKSLTIDLALSGEPLFVMMDATEIEQVIVNIVQNATLAATKDCVVKITSQHLGETARVSIADNGPGIPAEILPKIFDPFFSTRGTEGGTGLGLSVVHGIVADHGGVIWAESQPRAGAVFHVELPVSSNPAH